MSGLSSAGTAHYIITVTIVVVFWLVLIFGWVWRRKRIQAARMARNTDGDASLHMVLAYPHAPAAHHHQGNSTTHHMHGTYYYDPTYPAPVYTAGAGTTAGAPAACAAYGVAAGAPAPPAYYCAAAPAHNGTVSCGSSGDASGGGTTTAAAATTTTS